MSSATLNHFEDQYLGDLVKSFLDIIVLAMLNGKAVHGYLIIANLHRTFGVLLSPGTLYPLLYHLEKEKLIQVKDSQKKKLYTLTPLGLKKVHEITTLYKRNSERIFHFIDRNLFEEKLHEI